MLNIIIFKCISDTSSLSSYSIDFHVNKAYCCYFIGAYLFHWGCIGDIILHLTVTELGRGSDVKKPTGSFEAPLAR